MHFAQKVLVKQPGTGNTPSAFQRKGHVQRGASTEHALDKKKPALVLSEAEGPRILRLFMVTTNASTLGWKLTVINHKKTFWHKYTTKGKMHAISPGRFLDRLVLPWDFLWVNNKVLPWTHKARNPVSLKGSGGRPLSAQSRWRAVPTPREPTPSSDTHGAPSPHPARARTQPGHPHFKKKKDPTLC